MGQRTIRFSDLTNELILEDNQLARLVVVEHPALTNGPVQLETTVNEAAAIEDDLLDIAVIDRYMPEQEEPDRIYVAVKHFDALARDGKMAGILAAASAAKPSPGRGSTRSRSVGEKVNYASSVHAGEPHRGRTTEEEKQYVRDHFDEVNERLRSQGQRVIDLRDSEMVGRYGLEEFAKERGCM